MNTEQETLQRVVAILKEFGLPPEGEVDQFEWLREQLSAARRSSDEQAEVVGYILPRNLAEDVFQYTVYRIRSVAEAHAEKGSAVALYRAPAVAAGGVTEEMVERAMSAFIASVREQDPEWTDEFDEEVNLISPTGDGFAPYFPIRAALSAALAVGDEGIREGGDGN